MSTRDVSVLDRMLSPFAEALTSESAERLSRYQIDEQTQARIDDLADRAGQGALTDDERSEYLKYVEAIDLIGILRLKARQATIR